MTWFGPNFNPCILLLLLVSNWELGWPKFQFLRTHCLLFSICKVKVIRVTCACIWKYNLSKLLLGNLKKFLDLAHGWIVTVSALLMFSFFTIVDVP